MKKRIMSLLLAVVMVVSLLPVTALAADDITFGDLYGLIGERKFINSSNIALSFAESGSIITTRFDASPFTVTPKNTNVSVTSYGYQLNIETGDGANNIFDFYVSDHALTKVVVSGMVKTERNDEYYPYTPAADYSGVMAAIERYEALNASDYTSASWQALQDAVDRVIYDLEAVYQADVDAMALAILDAIDALVANNAHNFTGDYRDNGDGTHARKCIDCDEYGAPEAHSFTNGVCVCGAVESPAPAAPVPYLFYTADSNGVLTPVRKECETYEAVDSTTTVFDDGGWYVADGEITVGDRITVNNGTANLILKDGAKLTAQAGINVAEGSTLNIYAQSEGAAMGQLAAVGSDKVYTAGIGGGNKQNGGTVNIYGGTVSATGGWMSAGIGGGFKYSKGGSVTIYNGVVTVRGGYSAAGIGGGDGGDGGNVAIYGGTVTAIGDKYCPGIGSGFNGWNDGTLTLGRYVHFEAGDSAEKIDENATKDNFSKYDYVHTTTSDVALYEVTVDSSIKNGAVTVDKSACASGETVTLTATPTDGYELDSWNVTDKNGGPVTVNRQNQFTMPESDVTVSAAFISELDAAKEAAKKAIDDALPADASDAVKAAAEKAKAAIDAAGSVEDVDAAAEAGTEAIEKQIAGEEAAEQRARYQKKITDELLPAAKCDEAREILNKALADLDNAETVSDMDSIMNNAEEAASDKEDEFRDWCLESNLYFKDALTDASSDETKAFVAELEQALADATSIAQVKDIFNNNKSTIDFYSRKDNAIAYLNECISSDEASEEMKALARECLNKVKTATTMDELEAITAEFEPRMELQEAKDDFLAECNETLTSGEFSDETKSLIQEMMEEVKAAETIDEFGVLAYKTGIIFDCSEILSSDEYSDELKDIAQKILDEIKTAETADECDAVMDKYDSAISLQFEKDAAREEVKKLLPENASNAVKKIISDACDEIQANDDPDEYAEIIEAAKKAVEAQLQKDEELAPVKEAAKKAIDDALPADASDAVKAAAEKAKEAIDAADSAEDVEAAKEAGTEAIKKQIADEETAVKEKAQFKETITNTLLPAAKCDEAREILKQALADLDNAVTRDDVNKIYNQARGAANGKDSEFEAKRTGYNNAFDSALTPTSSDETKAFVAEMKQALADATSIAQVEEIYNTNKDKVGFCLTKDGTLNGLSGAIDSDEYSDAWKAIAREYCEQVKTASTMDELNAIRDKFSSELKLQSEKDEACKELEKLLSDDASYAEKKIISDACAEIQASDDPTKYDAIMEEASKAVKSWLEKEAEYPETKVFVTRFYSVCLGRQPGDEELGYYQWEIIDNGMTGSEVASKFIFSDEFCTKNYCDRHYVEALYKTFMGRVPGEDETAYWTWQLQQGKTREEVFNSFVSSAEFASFCTEADIEAGGAIKFDGKGTRAGGRCTVDGCKSADGLDRFVKRLYNVTLDRDPAQDELDAWVYFLIHGEHTAKTASHEFLFSEEFISRGYTDEVFVDYLYRAMMGRTPGADEVEYWVWRFSTGVTREDAFNEFADSDEFALICQDYGINCR